MSEWRAAVSSHASGFCGTPSRGQALSADTNASLRASSALATSRVCDGKIGHQAAVGLAGDALDRPMSVLLIASIHPVNPRRLASGASGRTSTAPIGGRRAARSPIEGGVKRGEFQDDESSQLLLRVSVRTVLHAPLSFPKAHRSSCLRHFQWIAADVDAGLDERLVVSPPGAEMRIGYRRSSVIANASGES